MWNGEDHLKGFWACSNFRKGRGAGLSGVKSLCEEEAVELSSTNYREPLFRTGVRGLDSGEIACEQWAQREESGEGGIGRLDWWTWIQ